ncbi:MAG: transcriptional regulator LysR family [Gammaproteobacteria bacterium]|jgi:DNA-binding transcriptional LysR family regulator|nr:transcriptional regulator LysR family [Gammaproteobacteria bacterium]
MPAMDTLLSMKVFRQVIESGTFVRAAERLSLSTAMTSKHLMHLEKHLGTRLLNRSSRSLSLTESGKLFFERCKAILEEVEEAESAIGSVSGVPRGTLRVTAPSWAATRLLVDMVASYRQRCPEVVVDLNFEDRFVDLIEEGYDLAIRATADPPPAGLIARPLRPMPFVIAASREYLQRYAIPQSPEDLAQHDCVMVGNGHSWPLAGPKGDIDVPARVVLRFGSMTIAVAHAVCAGIGLASLPRIIFEDPMFKDVLCPVLVKHPLRHPHLYAVYVSRKHLPLKIRTFIDHMVEHSEIPPPWNDLATVCPERLINGTPVVALGPEK